MLYLVFRHNQLYLNYLTAFNLHISEEYFLLQDIRFCTLHCIILLVSETKLGSDLSHESVHAEQSDESFSTETVFVLVSLFETFQAREK